MGDRRYSTLTRLGMGALTFNSALAVYNSWGDASSVGFVLTADAALGLLFLCLRDFERPGRGRDTKTKAAVWALTTLLTAMFASRVAPIMPPLASALVWSMAGPYSADVPRLAQAGLTVLTMTGATAVYRTAQDAGSVAFAIGGYVALLLLFRALSAYERAHAHPGAERRRKGLRRKSCRGPSRWPSGLWLLMQRSPVSLRSFSIMVPEYGYQLPCRMIARESQRKVVILLVWHMNDI
jgi:hypothetical protein